MKKILFFYLFLSLIMPVNAEVTNINGETYATIDSILVHCSDGQIKALGTMPQNDITHIIGRNEINPVVINGRQYFNITTLSKSLSTENQNTYVIAKSNSNRVNNIGRTAIKNYVYNGSEYSMQNDKNHLYVGNSIDKTINVIQVFNSDITPTWAKIRNLSRAFGY